MRDSLLIAHTQHLPFRSLLFSVRGFLCISLCVCLGGFSTFIDNICLFFWGCYRVYLVCFSHLNFWRRVRFLTPLISSPLPLRPYRVLVRTFYSQAFFLLFGFSSAACPLGGIRRRGVSKGGSVYSITCVFRSIYEYFAIPFYLPIHLRRPFILQLLCPVCF